MRNKIFVFVLLVVVFTVFMSFSDMYAQKGVKDGSRYGHGEDSIRCITNLSLYREYARQKDYGSAVKYWRIVFKECPRSSKNIYIDGVKIYKDFIDEQKNDETQSKFIDTLMMVYDQRINYYPKDKGDQRGRQGVDLLRYRRSDDLKYIKEAYGYLEESVNLEKTGTSSAVLATFLSASITLYQNKEIDEDKLINDYLTCNDILNAQLKRRPDSDILVKLKETQANQFEECGIDCDKLSVKFTSLFEEEPNNLENLKVITSVLHARGCTDSDLYYKALKNYFDEEPSSELAAKIARLAYERNKWKEAADYFKQAINIETDNITKATYNLELAKCVYKLNNKSEARSYALQAVKLKENWGDPYILIGRMYAESTDDCDNISLPKAIYWVAVDMFIKAKSIDPEVEAEANSLIQTYTKYFPNKEAAFFLGIHEDDIYPVKCWINESTKARF